MSRFKYKRVAIDFDGTLFEDCTNIDVAFNKNYKLQPKQNANITTKWLKNEGFEILIFTCRPDYHRKYMESLLKENNISFDYILFYTKPRVDLYIDDKGFRFKTWEETQKWIKNEMYPSQEPNTKFESILRKNKIDPLGNLQSYNKILDIGCGSGDVFNNIEKLPQLDGVEPDIQLRSVAERLNIYNTIYENISDVDISQYDMITLLGVLEHIENEKDFLKYLKDARQIYLTVPNAKSFHRLIGKDANIIQTIYDFNQNDIKVGHQRYYDDQSLLSTIQTYLTDFDVISFGTTSMKFGTNKQMESFIQVQKSIESVSKKFGLCGEGNFHGAELYIKLKRKK